MNADQFERDLQHIADGFRDGIENAMQAALVEIGTLKDRVDADGEWPPTRRREGAVKMAVGTVESAGLEMQAKVDRIIAFLRSHIAG